MFNDETSSKLASHETFSTSIQLTAIRYSSPPLNRDFFKPLSQLAHLLTFTKPLPMREHLVLFTRVISTHIVQTSLTRCVTLDVIEDFDMASALFRKSAY